jgi:signal transduction histidine kinase
VEEIFHKRALDAGLELRKVLPAESIFVDADWDRLVQLFTNLIGNALKFTDKGFIEVSAKPDGNVVECSVTDSGIGIPESELPYVFDKFRQVGRVHGPGEKGTGLGLSIVKGILDMHGGSVQAKSELGQGSRFIVRLPRVPG